MTAHGRYMAVAWSFLAQCPRHFGWPLCACRRCTGARSANSSSPTRFARGHLRPCDHSVVAIYPLYQVYALGAHSGCALCSTLSPLHSGLFTPQLLYGHFVATLRSVFTASARAASRRSGSTRPRAAKPRCVFPMRSLCVCALRPRCVYIVPTMCPLGVHSGLTLRSPGPEPTFRHTTDTVSAAAAAKLAQFKALMGE
jgi:hypothetical protein